MDEAELIKKYNIDIEALKKEQIKLAKGIAAEDSQDFSLATRFGAVETVLVKNTILAVVIVCDKDCNVLEQQYFFDKLRFPYLAEFRSYRELPTIIGALNKLSERPDVVFIRGNGITHPRLGIASHFSITANIPAIGVADSIFECDKVEGEDILLEGKKVGRVLLTKEKANPLYVSIGNGISLDTAFNLAKGFIRQPHKLVEPLHLAHKYAKEVRDELKL